MSQIFILFSLILCLASLEAGGVILYEISLADMRLASAGWSSRANDPSTAFTNPAGMTRFCRPTVEFGAQTIMAHTHFKADQRTTVPGSNGHGNLWLPAGSFYAIYPWSDSVTLGFASCGYFGSDLVYNKRWVGRYFVQKTLLEGLSAVPTIAIKLNEQWSIGAGVNVMYSFFRQRSAVRDLIDSRPDGFVMVRDYKFGVGGLVGLLWQPNCNTRLGIQYLSTVKLRLRATPHFSDIGPRLEAALKLGGVIGSKLNLGVRVPQSWIASIYHRFPQNFALMLDMGWQEWKHFQKLIFQLSDTNLNSITVTPKYSNCWHWAVGAEWYYTPCMTFSAGAAYDTSIVKSKNRTFNLPVGKQWRFGTGMHWMRNEWITMDLSTVLLWQGNFKAAQGRGGPFLGTVSGKFKGMFIYFVSANITLSF